MLRDLKFDLKVVDHSRGLMKALRELSNETVLVGVPDVNASRKDHGPINNAALAYIHNYGSPAANIPARPFLEPGIKDATPTILRLFEQMGRSALTGNIESTKKYLHAIGLKAQNSIRRVINVGVPPDLKPTTIAARLRRGRHSAKPLIDTGQLRNSITYVIRKLK